MRYLTLAVALALAAVTFLLPQPDPPGHGPDVGLSPPPISVCAVEEGSGRTTEISVVSTVSGPAQLTLFAAGATAGTLGSTTGAPGAVIIPIVDVAAVGTVGALVELPIATSAVGSIVFGAESTSAEACAALPAAQLFITGGTTAAERSFQVHLMNPYAGEAVLELVVNSEAGNESNSRFESVIVPPRSSTIVDFNDLTPGRENLSVAIETVTGRVNAVGRQGDAGESAVWNAVPAASDWFLPVPKGLGERRLIIATPSNTDIEYQVDLYTPEGVEEVFVSGSLPARGQVVVDLGEVTGDAVGVRVVSTGPIVSTLWTNSAAGLSVTNGSPVEANRWFLPGAGTPDGGGATMVLFNTGIEDTEIVLRPLRVNTSTRVFNLMSESTLEIGLEQADGYLVESTGPITVLWTSQREGSGSASIGVPIIDE